MRQRVIDERPAWEPFDDPDLPARVAGTEVEASDREIAILMEELEANLVHLEDDERLEGSRHAFNTRLDRAFPLWLERGGVDPERARGLTIVAGLFSDFLYRFGQGALGDVPEDEVGPFLLRWIYRKTGLGGTEMSAAPTALRVFARYLDAVGATGGLTALMDERVADVEPEFEETLRLFHGPPEGTPVA
jgi:hypothetical protein